ncbi:MAG: twin-arginine translocase TatA/TatE family subunit [Alphaproteobacteria bacterium]|nr:twin-arginine translocase TatA/TatE family subunit [Alphaproteobacteria bacterium]
MRFGFWEIIIIAALIFILFGSQKFPGMMKNLAEGIKVFKKEISGDKKEKKDKPEAAAAVRPASRAKIQAPGGKPKKKKSAKKK